MKDFLTVNNNLFVNNFLLDGDCAYESNGIMINSGKFNGKLRSEVKNNIILETTGYSRNQVFAFQKYIDLFLK